MDYIVVGYYFSKFLIVRKIPNTSTHLVIKELGMIFTEFGHPFVLKVRMVCATLPGSSTTSLNYTNFTISPAAHIIHKAMDLLKLWWAF